MQSSLLDSSAKEHLSKAFMTKQHCRKSVLRILNNRILIGHALDNDLEVLGISHPWWLIRDTAKFQPFLKQIKCECVSILV